MVRSREGQYRLPYLYQTFWWWPFRRQQCGEQHRSSSGYSDVGGLKLMTIIECWWQNLSFLNSPSFWLRDRLYRWTKWRTPSSMSNIRHQHCDHYRLLIDHIIGDFVWPMVGTIKMITEKSQFRLLIELKVIISLLASIFRSILFRD